MAAYALCTNAWFERLVLVLIFVSGLTMTLERPGITDDPNWKEFFNLSNLIFTAAFTMELVVKVLPSPLPLPYSDAQVANRNGRDFGWEIAHGTVSRRPPISLDTNGTRTHICTRTTRKFGICIWPFSVALCQPSVTIRKLCHRCIPVEASSTLSGAVFWPSERFPSQSLTW